MTRLFDLIAKEAESGRETDKLMLKVWSPTPWIVEFKEFEVNSREWFEAFEWLDENIGPESSPIHEREGVWHRGNAVVFGINWYGFATEDLMSRFSAQYPERIVS